MPGAQSRARRSRRGGHAVVASGHPVVCEAAAGILRSGGNAFDAIVAAGMAASVAEPGLTSLGGGGFLLARTAEGREMLFDFFVDTPGRGLEQPALEPHFLPVTLHFSGTDQVFNAGLGSIAVPGNMKGFVHVQRRLGRLPLAAVVAPAVRMAREGVAVNPQQAYVLTILEPILTLTDRSRSLFAPRGRVPAEGERVVYSELADFLERLPTDSERAFYEGELAQQVDRDMRASGGLVTAADLAAYRVIEREPLCVAYRGHRLLTNPPPAFGGTLIDRSLQLLASRRLATLAWGSAEHLRILAAVMEEVERARERGHDAAPAPGAEPSETRREPVRRSTRGTTHVSVSDADGNVASMTTSNGEGSGYVAPGTGVMLNNMLGEDDLHPDGFHAGPPGERVGSMMSPSILVRDGRVRLVVGSGGSKRIRTALLQVISNVVDFGMSVREAVAAPRLHWDGDRVQVEPGFAAEAIDALRRSWDCNVWSQRDLYFGGVHAVDPSGEGAGDVRRGGAAVIVGARADRGRRSAPTV